MKNKEFIKKWNESVGEKYYIKDNTLTTKPFVKECNMKFFKNKYKAIKSAGYDSKMEHKQALLLKAREKAGEITNLKEQVKFVLQEGFTNNQGQKIREIAIIVDFCYYDRISKQLIVDDAKGFRTADFKLKKKLFMFKYPDYVFLENGKVKEIKRKKICK